ncbi:MAG: DUF1700 domain-containing protein [Lachnospiraceae bacterium]|jgi:hypothetical protein|nr:DUF1700 domain-containing protein [Lachnospiraceae bacterium]
MSREEFLKGLEEALAGEAPNAVIRDNLIYYREYISQEMAKGRTMEEIVAEIGEPRIVAKTIIDSCEAAGEALSGAGAFDGMGGYQDEGTSGYGTRRGQRSNIHYFDLTKWYWRILIPTFLIITLVTVLNVVGSLFYLLFRFAGPILVLCLVFWLLKNMRK